MTYHGFFSLCFNVSTTVMLLSAEFTTGWEGLCIKSSNMIKAKHKMLYSQYVVWFSSTKGSFSNFHSSSFKIPYVNLKKKERSKLTFKTKTAFSELHTWLLPHICDPVPRRQVHNLMQNYKMRMGNISLQGRFIQASSETRVFVEQ